MDTQKNPTTRGRPKTLDRDHIIEIAKESFMSEGPTHVSINEICKRSGVSKPGLYREFGNEDGLRRTVLRSYRDENLEPLYAIFQSGGQFSEIVEALIDLFRSSQLNSPTPKGCLLQDMSASRGQMGELTADTIDMLRAETIDIYEDWIARAKEKGEISTDLSNPVAAIYVDLQLASAMVLMKRQASPETVGKFLRTAFSVFSN
ncbi:TetR/AcrR family transcriptional regulator [Phaeobacter sp. J2-8]|uniref:TetR/AcrR family transcriptional regulator n=1 Tax=Phaeobacter sp. J2-8 TaxID=2931394 RepID=UPI001FD24D92|nr:TetR/AcrR family transcriptional regulator [Phaeobacter sp. J2-8]MCJ7871162.1 TetR/AcrR family transcriptional regulator [Phaeobacter sp. J2-8]